MSLEENTEDENAEEEIALVCLHDHSLALALFEILKSVEILEIDKQIKTDATLQQKKLFQLLIKIKIIHIWTWIVQIFILHFYCI